MTVSTTTRRPLLKAIAALFVTTAVVGALAGSAVAAPATADRSARWQLVDWRQTTCFSSLSHEQYLGIFVDGRWTGPMQVTARDLPSGGTSSMTNGRIAPGSSDGRTTVGYLHVILPSETKLGTYTATMKAKVGQKTDSIPIRIEVKSSCGY